MNHPRPKNLNLFTIRFPLPAIVSLLHRISGFALFLLIPLALWGLDVSLTNQGFEAIQDSLHTPLLKGLIWLLLVPFCYHLVAGIRHLLTDIHIGDSLQGGRMGARITLVVSFLLVILAGVWLW